MSLPGYAGYHAKQRAAAPLYLPRDAVAEALRMDATEREQRRTPLYEWSLRVPEPKSGTLDFDRFPFQLELYREAAADKDLCVRKATQVGVSAFLVRWTMYWADTKGLVALYVFPTRDHVYDFSDQRLTPAIEGSEYLRGRITPGNVMNKGLKQIGLGFLYFRGSETKRALDSVDADILALDEYDTLVQSNIADAERRISGSQIGLVRRVGVPSISDFGITKEYDRSDQRRWLVRCGACGERQPVRFKENVARKDKKRTPAVELAAIDPSDETPFLIVCERCRKPLDVRKGEWVATYPDRTMRGYHIPRLIVPETDLRKIAVASKDREPFKRQTHFNKDLAEPWEGEGGRLTKKDVRAAQREFPMVEGADTANLVTAGIDVASTRALNVRVSEHISDREKKALWIGEVDSFDELDNIMRHYGVKLAAIDHLPEHRLARGFAERFPGRVYLVGYSSQKDPLTVDDQGRAWVRRVEVIDTVVTQIRQQRNLLPRDLPLNYADHLTAVVRRIEKDDEDRVTVHYVSTGPDDYLHAEAYDVVARELWLVRQAVEEAQEERLTPLDEMLDFERSDLDQDSTVYSPGFSDGEYRGM